MAAAMPPADQATLADPRTRQVLLADMQEAFRQGTRGPAWDAVIVARTRDIDLRGINAPVTFWHGDADRNAPIGMAEYLHGLIPGSRLRVYPGEGHFSVIVRHCEEIVGALITPADRSAGY
jgi:pimeloyl-ACP methyl ester carboxylesterase